METGTKVTGTRGVGDSGGWTAGLQQAANVVSLVVSLNLLETAGFCMFSGLRIGYSRLTHSYLLCGDDPPTCQSCGIPLTVKHIIGMYQLGEHS